MAVRHASGFRQWPAHETEFTLPAACLAMRQGAIRMVMAPLRQREFGLPLPCALTRQVAFAIWLDAWKSPQGWIDVASCRRVQAISPHGFGEGGCGL